MASSRLEKLGTIYTRISGLLKAGAMKLEDKPLWYDLYKAFPPDVEPRIDRPLPTVDIKPIFYEEDEIRAKFHKSHKFLKMVRLNDTVNPSTTQKLISVYNRLKSERKEATVEQLYQEALDVISAESVLTEKRLEETGPSVPSDSHSIVNSFTEAKEKEQVSDNVNIKDIFKE